MTRRKTPIPATPDDLDPLLHETVAVEEPLAFESPESSSVTAARYDVRTRQLFVTLKKSGEYRFTAIDPALWVEFMEASSKGQYFSSRIRPFYVGVKV